jgi:hypothetical protein
MMNDPPLGRAMVNFPLKHLGILTLKIDLPVEVVDEVDVD